MAGSTMKCIRVATGEDAESIVNLRVAAFAGSGQFRMKDDSQLGWDAHDEAGQVLSAWDEDGQAISTTRGEILYSAAEAEHHMMSSFPAGSELFPSLLISRGATLKGLGRSGLHSALRYHLIATCINLPVQSVTGLVYSGAPRLNLMKAIGYEFYECERNWETEAEILGTPIVAVLRRENIDKAAEALLPTVAATLAEYPWCGPSLQFDLSGGGRPSHAIEP